MAFIFVFVLASIFSGKNYKKEDHKYDDSDEVFVRFMFSILLVVAFSKATMFVWNMTITKIFNLGRISTTQVLAIWLIIELLIMIYKEIKEKQRKKKMAKKYVKKPVVIEAVEVRSSPESEEEIIEFVDYDMFFNEDGEVIIRTLEGDMKADIGDFIIKGVNGEFYPCKPDIFWKSYEKYDNE